MELDHQKFNRYLIGPKKRGFAKVIESAKAGCRLSLTSNDSKQLFIWAGRWHKAVIYLRIINAMSVSARDKSNIEELIKHFKHRVSITCDDNKDANNFAVIILKEYRDKLMKKQKGKTE